MLTQNIIYLRGVNTTYKYFKTYLNVFNIYLVSKILQFTVILFN